MTDPSVGCWEAKRLTVKYWRTSGVVVVICLAILASELTNSTSSKVVVLPLMVMVWGVVKLELSWMLNVVQLLATATFTAYI